MKILNLFAGIGGNRTLWGDKHKITAVEYDQQIALIYHKRFPEDEIIIGDAYEYLEDHFEEFDFVWASPPCQTHTGIIYMNVGHRYNGKNNRVKLPDYRLWTLIHFLKEMFRGDWVVENVISYYKPIIPPTTTIGRHYIWCSRYITPYLKKSSEINLDKKENGVKKLCKIHKIDYEFLDKYCQGLNKITL
ncbi:MAG: DNA cytosine methyltransferase, partial [Candidatus Cloacimonetes bacterium]|nr:DNA cytosine methyltransferase [Candidatus Cloacimonadota bacterium]